MDRCKSLVDAILGGRDPSWLMTDGYKFAMAQAGFPLRWETFHLAFRLGGPWYIPFDFKDLIKGLIPRDMPTHEQTGWLTGCGYKPTSGMLAVMESACAKGIDTLEIHDAPKGSWVLGREPLLAMAGPSFLGSWFESLGLMFHFPIQVATEILKGRREFRCTCWSESEIVRLVVEELGFDVKDFALTVETDQYRNAVARRIRALVDALDDKNPARIFEVGMRAVTCLDMHRIALDECRLAGIRATSNVFLAHEMGMTAVGTTGHEHIQRWGDDLSGNRAMRDMRPQRPSYLPDTFDAMQLGLAAAVKSLHECPWRQGTVRLDSGDQWPQLTATEIAARRFLLNAPNYIFEDGIDDEKILRDEGWCRHLDIAAERRSYGSGNFIVKSELTDLGRDRVAAVWKLSQSGDKAVMKTCATAPTKASVPGVPVAFRRDCSVPCATGFEGFAGLIGQTDEQPPQGFAPLAPRLEPPSFPVGASVGFSPRTKDLIDGCLKNLSVRPDWAWKPETVKGLELPATNNEEK